MKEKQQQGKSTAVRAVKTTLKWGGGVVAGVLLLIVLIAVALYLPPVQNFVVKQVTRIASESTGMTIGINRVRLAFPIDLSVEGITVLKPGSAAENGQDTIAVIDKVRVDVAMLPLFKGMVNVNELLIREVQFDTSDLVASAKLCGSAGELRVQSRGINLLTSEININDVLLASAKVDIQLADTTAEDTVETENVWKIHLGKLAIKDSELAFRTADDSLSLRAGISSAEAENGFFDLGAAVYKLENIALNANELHYDNPFEPQADGLDFNHIALNDISLAADSIYYSDTRAYVRLTKGCFTESNGLRLTRLSGVAETDSTALYVRNLNLYTAASSLSLDAAMAFNAFEETNPGNISLSAKAELGRSDLMLFLSGMPKELQTAYPYYPLTVTADMNGTMKQLSLNSVNIVLPASFDASLSGTAGNLTDMNSLFADIDLHFTAYNLAFLTSAFLTPDLQNMISIPSGTTLDGSVSADANEYGADLKLQESGGSLALSGACTINNGSSGGASKGDAAYPDITYSASITSSSFPVAHFVSGVNISPVTLAADISGAGTDFFDRRTRLFAAAKLGKLNVEGFDLDGSAAEVKMENSVAAITLDCVNDIVSGTIEFDAFLNANDIKGTLACMIDNADLHALGACDVPLTTSLNARVDLETDLDEFHAAKGCISDVYISDSTTLYRARDLEIDAFTRPDTTWLSLSSGDLDLRVTAQGGYKTLASLGGKLSDELMRQVERKYISQDTLLRALPAGHLTMHSGRSNFVCGYARRMGYDFREINADIDLSPSTGINGYAQIDSLCAFGMQIDHLRFEQETEEDIFKYTLQAKNEADNPQYSFNLLLDGSLFATGSNLRCRLFDAADSLGVNVALAASLEHGGIRISLTDEEEIIGYEKFTTNNGNYVFMGDNGRIAANLRLKSSAGAGLQIFSDNENKDALQDITLEIYDLDLAPIAAVIPYCPEITGILSGDFHVIQTQEELSVSSAIGVDSLSYEGIEMGDLYTELVYMPLDNGGHYLDALLNYDGQDVGTLQGTYIPRESDDYLKATATLNQIPLNLVDGFIPDMIIGLKGYGDGELTVEGLLSDLRINGTIDLDSAYVVSVPYGIELAIDERPVTIKDSKLVLDDFRLYGHNEQPLVINGEIDCSDLANMETRLRLVADNWLLIDSKEENKRSEAYGKAYVNLNALATGSLASLKIIGALDVLGNTDVTYILRDSPLSTDNEMEGLVQFTDFSSEEQLTVARPATDGIYMDLRISVAKDARVFCALNATKTNYLDMTGGGDLRMIYSGNDIRMTGRYTVEEGEMKYSLPVIPLKTFSIEEGSYVEFTGDVMDPTLDITATETTKANATVNGVSQSVTFNCGVAISQTLNNMGLAFVIEAPENMTINSELQSMSADERNKVAVTLLTTGMYLSDNNLSSFSMNSALSSFLQSEINNISNNALRTLDLSVGIDNTTDATGDTHTDYTFKFAKRLWNNRVRIVVGGKVSSNNANMESLFDNVAFEYRLDKNSYTNLRLFYDRATYDYLEGYVGQYGVGIAWNRQLQNFGELFKKKSSGNDTSQNSDKEREKETSALPEDGVSEIKEEQ